MLGVSFDRLFNPIQTGLFLAFPELRGGGGVNRPPPLHFLKTMEVCIGCKISHDNEHLAIGGREGIPVSGAMSRNILVVDKLGAIPSVNVRISISFFRIWSHVGWYSEIKYTTSFKGMWASFDIRRWKLLEWLKSIPRPNQNCGCIGNQAATRHVRDGVNGKRAAPARTFYCNVLYFVT